MIVNDKVTGAEGTAKLVENYHFAGFHSQLLLYYHRAEAILDCDFIVADSNTAELLGKSMADCVLPPGEPHKTLTQIEQLLGAFAAKQLTRNSTVLAFGGGVLCDLVGFAAASYMRGCNLILVPTTLLAMVDAALGGKTGCNFQNYKNMVGSFYPARQVRLVPEMLASLPAREFRSGLAELCKHALLSDTNTLWQHLQQKKGTLQAPILQGERAQTAATQLRDLLIEGVRIKGAIVQRDLYEQGERAFLNLGHTYAHALEKTSSFACTHGEAVAWGINQALHLSASQGYCTQKYRDQVKELLLTLGFVLELKALCPALCAATTAEQVAAELLAAMQLDKKRGQREQGGIRLVLQRGRGQTFIAELTQDLIAHNLQL